MRVHLRSGRTIALSRLEQWPTYYGVLCGRPNARINEGFITQALDQARERNPNGAEPFLLAPPAGDLLPRVSCIATFDSGELARPGSEPYSSLTVVWFHEEFGVPAGGKVMEQLSTIDWEVLAFDWCW